MLSYSQYSELEEIYERANNPDQYTVGVHYELIACLGRLGKRVGSWQEAMREARKLLDQGWKDEQK
jgi:hypothetical protein